MALVPRVQGFFVWIIVDHGVPLKLVRKGYIYIFERICMGIVNIIQRCVLFFILFTGVKICNQLQSRSHLGVSLRVWVASGDNFHELRIRKSIG